MQGVTLAVAVVGSILALCLRPAYALATYFAVLFWYPYYLRISIGTIDIAAGRIVVMVLFLRCLCDDRIRNKFVWSRLDTWISLSMVVYIVMFCITRPLSMALENRAGFLMDTWFAYITVRLIVRDREELVSTIKGVSLVLAALAILGVIESTTGQYVFAALKRFRPWAAITGEVLVVNRLGFTRATGPFSHPILFGLCFVIFLPLIWALRFQRDYWGKLAYPLSALIVIGALSSMSSGSWMALMVTLTFLGINRYKRWVKHALVFFVFMCLCMEVASNRPLHHVFVSYLNPVGGEGWQRARLIDCAIEDFGKWWLLGYRGQDPGWGPRTGVGHTDLNNEFLLAGVNYGIWGIVALCGVFIVAIKNLVRMHKILNDTTLQSWIWSMGATLLAFLVASMGVSFFGQLVPLFYCIIGIVGASTHLQEARPIYISKRI